MLTNPCRCFFANGRWSGQRPRGRQDDPNKKAEETKTDGRRNRTTNTQASNRFEILPIERGPYIGFRCVQAP